MTITFVAHLQDRENDFFVFCTEIYCSILIESALCCRIYSRFLILWQNLLS